MDELRRASRLAFYFVAGLVLGGFSVVAGATTLVIDANGKIIGSYSDGPTWRMPSGWGAQAAGGGLSANGSGGVTIYNKAKISGGGVSALVNLAKNVNSSGVAQVARVAARILGPAFVLASVIDLFWDPDEQQWMKPGEPEAHPSDPDPGNLWYRDYPAGCISTAPCSFSALVDDVMSSFSSSYVFDYVQVLGSAYYVVVKHVTTGAAASRQVYKAGPDPNPASGNPSVASDSDLDTSIQTALQQDPGLAPQVLQQAIQATGQLPAADPIVSTGPASIQGPQTVSTSSGPAGMTTTTTNTNYSLTYGGPVVTVTENKSVTYTAPDGSQTTTNDTTTPGSDSDKATDPEPAKPLCEQFPDASGCAKLGSGTDPGPVAEQAVDVNQITPESIGGTGGACPADRVMNTSYGALTFSWSNLCGLAEGVRPVILAMAWLVAGFSFFFGAKRSGV